MTLFETGLIGRTYHGPTFDVRAEHIRRYAAATNDQSSPRFSAGEIAPPVFAFVALRPLLRRMLKDVTPLYEQLRGVHGQQDMHYLAEIVPGMRLRPSGRVLGILQRRTGVAVVLEMTTKADSEAVVLNRHYTTVFFSDQSIEEDVGIDAPSHLIPDDARLREPDERIVVQLDEDQPARYADASGDTGQYHLDADVAREHGFEGVIVHGMCTLAIAGHNLTQALVSGESTRARRLAARFTKPVYPGHTLVVAAWRMDVDGAVYAFQMRDRDGDVVLTHGRLEFSPESESLTSGRLRG